MLLLCFGTNDAFAQETEGGENACSWMAEGRTRWESLADPLFGIGPEGEDAWLQRLHLGVDWQQTHWEARLLLGLHGQDGLDNARPRDAAPIDLQEVYVGGRFADDLVRLRVGRQSITMGRKRFIDNSNSSNTRFAYDGVDLRLVSGDRELRGFVVQPVQNLDGAFDDQMDDRIRLAVLQAAKDARAGGGALWELYALRFRVEAAGARDVRHALGLRQVRSVMGWELDTEVQLQDGSHNDQDVRAYALGAIASRPFSFGGADNALWLQLDLASGDDPNSDRLERFNPLLPSRSTFSQGAFTGYANLRHFKIGADFARGPWKSTLATGLMQRMRTDDAVFAHSSVPLPGSANASNARSSGQYWQIKAERSLWQNAKTYLEYVHFNADRAVTAAGGSNQDYFGWSIEWAFGG